jgi:hypothetical protein
MRTTYEFWYHDPDAVVTNMLSNPDFARQFDLWAYIDLDAQGECRKWAISCQETLLGSIVYVFSIVSPEY